MKLHFIAKILDLLSFSVWTGEGTSQGRN